MPPQPSMADGQGGMPPTPGTQSDPMNQLMSQTMSLTMQLKSINSSFPGGEDEMEQAVTLILQSMKKKAQGLNVPMGGPSPSIPY
jgi:hypothetical protein